MVSIPVKEEQNSSRVRLGQRDLWQSLRAYRVWLHLGFLEVKQRYQRSVLGPWWISISMFVFISAMGVVFSRLFAQNLADYIPFFSAGFLLWNFISSCINDSTEIFRSNSGFIKQVKLPYNIYFLKFFVKNAIFLAHNFVIYLLVICFFKFNPGWKILLALPGFALLCVNLYWISLLVSMVSTRFRDMVPIVNSCVQIAFFITPISWMPKLLGADSILIKLNPLVYFLDIVRQPLLGSCASLSCWMVNLGIALVGLSLSLSIFSYMKTRIPFWID